MFPSSILHGVFRYTKFTPQAKLPCCSPDIHYSRLMRPLETSLLLEGSLIWLPVLSYCQKAWTCKRPLAIAARSWCWLWSLKKPKCTHKYSPWNSRSWFWIPGLLEHDHDVLQGLWRFRLGSTWSHNQEAGCSDEKSHLARRNAICIQCLSDNHSSVGRSQIKILFVTTVWKITSFPGSFPPFLTFAWKKLLLLY